MRTLGLDISTKTGFSVLEPFSIIAKGLIESKVEGNFESDNYPFNYLDMAKINAKNILALCYKFDPDVVVIEETNKGKNRYSQKQLEFLHFAVAEALRPWIENGKAKLIYLDTSQWRTLIGIEYSKEDRLHNKEHSHQRGDFKKKVMAEVYACFDPEMSEEIEAIDSKRARNKFKGAYEDLIEDIVRESMGKFKVRIEGKVAGKVSKKKVTVDLVNRVFQTKFKGRDNDICDSISLCLGYYELIGVPNIWRATIHTKSSGLETQSS